MATKQFKEMPEKAKDKSKKAIAKMRNHDEEGPQEQEEEEVLGQDKIDMGFNSIIYSSNRSL